MFCLSVREPWATCIFRHGKNVENRRWSSTFRGTIAIHASTKLDFSPGTATPTEPDWPHLQNWIKHHTGVLLPLNWSECGFMPGYVLGTVVLRAITTDDFPSPWAIPGQLHWHLTDVRPFRRPFRWPGQQRLFNIPNGRIEGAY